MGGWLEVIGKVDLNFVKFCRGVESRVLVVVERDG
jgi:hypothetical protein